jgi:hypothetical protein
VLRGWIKKTTGQKPQPDKFVGGGIHPGYFYYGGIMETDEAIRKSLDLVENSKIALLIDR